MKPQSRPRPPGGRTRSGFDRVARVYRWAEYLFLGPLLTRTRNHLLSHITDVQHALVLGDGDGRFLARLLRAAPNAQAIAIDGSRRMLGLLSARCAFATPRVQTRQALVPELPDDLDLRCVDLVVTHFFLDCLSQGQLEQLCTELAHRVAPGCRWLLSDFAVPRSQPWRVLGQAYIRGLYLAFGVLTGLRVRHLPDPAKALTAAGFCRIHHRERLDGLLYTELWQRSA